MPTTAPIPLDPADPEAPFGAASGHEHDYGRFLVASGPYMLEGSGALDFTLVPVDVPAPSELLLVSIADGRTQTLSAGITDFVASGDRTHLLVRKGRALERIPNIDGWPVQ